MDSIILIKQLFVLFAMIATGYCAFRLKFFGKIGQHEISTLIAKILTPAFILSSVTGEYPENISMMMRQSAVLAVFYLAVPIAGSLIYVLIRRPARQKRYIDLLVLSFTNVGFFAVPIVRGVFGDSFTVYLIPYILGFNFMVYTLGTYYAIRTGDGTAAFSLIKMLNPGTIAAVAAMLVFLTGLRLPSPVVSVLKYFGDTGVPLSMLLIGASLAQLDLKKVILSADNWIVTIVKMLIIPAAGILLVRNLPFEKTALAIFLIEISMPAASLIGVLAEEYGRKGNEANKMIALTTLVSVVTIPLLSLLL